MLVPDEADRPEDAAGVDESADGASLLSNTRILIGGRLLGAALAWGGTVLIVRTLTQAEFGDFSFVFSLLAIVSIVADLGLGRIAVSGVMDTSHDHGRFAANYIMLRTSLGAFAVLAALVYVTISDQSNDVRLATLIGCVVVFLATPAGAYDIAYQVHDRWLPVSIAGLVGQLSATALVVALALAGGNWIWFVVPAVVREVVELAMKWREAHDLVPFRYQLDIASWWPMLKEAVPLSIGTAIAMIYYRVDSVMLKEMVGSEAVATYAVGYKFADLMHIIPFSLTASLLASMVRFWPDDVAGFRTVTRQSGQLLMLIAALVITGFTVFGGAAIDVLYGSQYVEGENAARLLVLSEGTIFFSLLAFTALIATGRHAVYPFITLLGLVVNIVLNLMFIPRWSFEGAALTTLITEGLVAVLLWHQLLRIPGIRPLGLMSAPRILAASLVAGFAGWGMWKVIPWPIAAVVTAIVFVGAVTIMGVGGERGIRGLIGESLTA